MTGANTVSSVAFGTEAGQFQAAGISTVICGPGDIAVAHKTDEYTTRDQLAQCEAFLSTTRVSNRIPNTRSPASR